MDIPKPKDYVLTISKQTLAGLPSAQFDGEIVIVDTAEGALHALQRIKRCPVVGFDTETRPTFKKGQSNQVSLLQLSDGHRCWLFRLNAIGLMPEIVDYLQDSSHLKVGLSLHDDFHNLSKLSPLEPAGFIDLQQYVKEVRIQDNSLSRIYGIIFGKRISKGQRLTNWEASTLSPAQQQYAALDAVACVDIYMSIHSGQFDPESSPYITLPEDSTEDLGNGMD